MKRLITAAFAVLAPFGAFAGADFVKGDRTFAADAELGATLTTGNSETASVKGRLHLKHELGNWENQYLLEGLYKEDTEVVTAKRYFAGMQADYKLDVNDYLFANGNYEVDPFTGYEYRLSGAAGIGHRFYETEVTFLDAEIGPGYIFHRLDDEQAALAMDNSKDSFIVHGAVKFETEFSDNAKFGQSVIVDYGDKLDGRSETWLSANIVGALAMKFAVIVRYNSEPLGEKKSTDTETNMTLLYSF